MLTKKELVEMLDGRKIGYEITSEEEKLAKDNNLVVVFGASDDLIEFRGAIYDEGDCYNANDLAVTVITRDGIFEDECENEDCPYKDKLLEQMLEKGEAVDIAAHWCGKFIDHKFWNSLGKPDWCYSSKQLAGKYETFKIFDDDVLYCVGWVFDLNEAFSAVKGE